MMMIFLPKDDLALRPKQIPQNPKEKSETNKTWGGGVFSEGWDTPVSAATLCRLNHKSPHPRGGLIIPCIIAAFRSYWIMGKRNRARQKGRPPESKFRSARKPKTFKNTREGQPFGIRAKWLRRRPKVPRPQGSRAPRFPSPKVPEPQPEPQGFPETEPQPEPGEAHPRLILA